MAGFPVGTVSMLWMHASAASSASHGSDVGGTEACTSDWSHPHAWGTTGDDAAG